MQSLRSCFTIILFSTLVLSHLPAATQVNDPFKVVRELYLSDDIVYGEPEITLRLLVAIGNRDDVQLSEEFKRALSAYEYEASQLDTEVLFSDGVERKQLEKLRKDYKHKTAENLLSLVDKEVLLQQIQRKNLEFLEEWGEDYRILDPTFLTNRFLVDRLRLTEKQKKNLKTKQEEVLKIQNGLWDEFGDAYYSMANEALADVKEILDTQQRREFEKLVGTPVNWSRMFESNRQFEYVFRVSDPNSNHKSVNLRRGPTSKSEELEDLPEIDVFLFQLLSTSFLQQELDLTGEQEQTLRSILEDYGKHRVVDETNSVQRFESLLNSDVTVPKEISELLIRHQLETLKQVELQLRTGAYRFSFGLLHPQLASTLDLSTNQMARIRAVSEQFSGEVDAFAIETKTQFRKLLRKNYLETMTILSSNQLNHYSLLTGQDTTNFHSK